MSRSFSVLACGIALFLAAFSGSAAAQQAPVPEQAPPATPGSPQDSEDRSAWQEWRGYMHQWMMGDDDEERPGGRMGWRGDGGPGMMWGGGMRMHSGMMPMMMMAMIDTDGNGSISYEEVEAVHRRMFNLVDEDKNGQLSAEEIQAVMGRGSVAQ
jgi:hypothetical protein